MTRTAAFASAATLAAVLALTGCASSDDDQADDPGTTGASATPSAPETTPTDPSSSATSEPAPPATGVTIEVTFDGDTITPNGERVEVPAGEDVTLDVTADAPGEIHVHSSPEQTLEYAAGTSTLTIGDLDQPGVVEVESHDLDKVIVQLQVQ